ncbi:MAG: tRNA-dihydrouridine synthase [Deltaproteobacteria bacterium]|nr:tRNA-dihydrouridine synthase [Deltaproteobacteria bacterium]
MKLYDLDLARGLLLAPLSGYTSWPMRVLSRRFGAELCYTEMISAEGLLRNTRNTLSLLRRPLEDSPLVAQIFTPSPGYAAPAARIIEDQGFDGIDINMGCPVKKVVSKGAGAALMRDLPLARSVADAVVNAVRIPVSVKMRAGWDSGTINAVELAAALEKTGVHCLILHPRTRTAMYKGTPQWDLFTALRQSVSIPMVASGDIRTVPDLERLRTLGCDAFMVGRSAVGRPWVFRELSGGSGPSVGERRDIMLEHLDMLGVLYGRDKAAAFMKKFVSGYVRGLEGASIFRSHACAALSYEDLKGMIKTLPAGPVSVIKE